MLRREEYDNADVKNVTDLLNFLYKDKMGEAVIKRIIKKDNENDTEYSITYENPKKVFVYRVIRDEDGKIDIVDIN